jgi:hypothetical protein
MFPDRRHSRSSDTSARSAPLFGLACGHLHAGRTILSGGEVSLRPAKGKRSPCPQGRRALGSEPYAASAGGECSLNRREELAPPSCGAFLTES